MTRAAMRPHLLLVWEALSALLQSGLFCQAQKEAEMQHGRTAKDSWICSLVRSVREFHPTNERVRGVVRLNWQCSTVELAVYAYTQLILKSPVARFEMMLYLWSILKRYSKEVLMFEYTQKPWRYFCWKGLSQGDNGISRNQQCEFKTLLFVMEAWLIKGMLLPTFFGRGIWTGEEAVL